MIRYSIFVALQFIIQMILLLTTMLICIASQTQTTEYPLLRVDLYSNSEREYQQLTKNIKDSSIGEFISTNLIPCNQSEECPTFQIYDPYGALLEEYVGISSIARYMDIIQRHINLNNYPIVHQDDLQKLKDEEISFKIFQERRKLSELQKSEDWERAIPTSKKKGKSQHKPSSHSHEKNKDMHKVKKSNLKSEDHQQANSKEYEPINLKEQGKKNNQNIQKKDGVRSQNVEHVFAWKVAFIFMTACLYFGMKYLKHQQQRIKKFDSSLTLPNTQTHTPYDEGQSLNSQ